LASAPPLLSQQQPRASATPPQPPLLKRAPDSSQWVITFKPQGAASDLGGGAESHEGGAPPARPKVMTVTKNGNTICEKLVNENGATIETWRVPGAAVSAVNGKNPVISPVPANTFHATDYSAADFAGFDWISLQNFAGRQDFQGRPCLVFKNKMVTMEPAEINMLKSIRAAEIAAQIDREEEAAAKAGQKAGPEIRTETPIAPFNPDDFKVEVVAYIDDQSRMPVALVYGTPKGAMTRTYQFQPSPGSLLLPPEVRSLLEKYWERRKRL
jgi:hypothetical protein